MLRCVVRLPASLACRSRYLFFDRSSSAFVRTNSDIVDSMTSCSLVLYTISQYLILTHSLSGEDCRSFYELRERTNVDVI